MKKTVAFILVFVLMLSLVATAFATAGDEPAAADESGDIDVTVASANPQDTEPLPSSAVVNPQSNLPGTWLIGGIVIIALAAACLIIIKVKRQ